MIILKSEQGTKEWLDDRMQKITGTKLPSVMGDDKAQATLIAELLAEEATEQVKTMRSTETMERGNVEEIFAVKAFEKRTGKQVDRVGLCVSEEWDWVAQSPDGLIQNEKGIYTEALEIKCPDTKKRILYEMHNKIPLSELGLESSFLKAEMIEILEKNNIDHNPKAVVKDLQELLPEGQTGKPSAGAPFLGIPTEYKWQAVHYFIVNPDLETLHFGVYDARIINEEKQLYIVSIEKKNEVLQEAISEAKERLIEFRAKWLRFREIILPSNF